MSDVTVTMSSELAARHITNLTSLDTVLTEQDLRDTLDALRNAKPVDIALADAIYLAAGRLPKVEDDDGYSTLHWLDKFGDVLPSVVNLSGRTGVETKEQHTVLCRLRDMGLVAEATADIKSRYYGMWQLTDAGRAFVAGEGEG